MPGMTVSELQVKVTADTKEAESGLTALGGKLGSIGGGIATAFGGAAIAGVAALGAGLALATKSAASFEKQISSIKAVSGATGSEIASLQDLALDLGAKTSFSASEAAKGIEELIKAGVSIGDVMGGAASASLSLAAAGAISVGDAAEIAANAMNQFGLKGTDLAHVSDLIAGAANASAIDVNDFKFSLAAVGAVANTVGATFDDTAAAIALLGQAGIKGSDAGTSLKTMLMSLQPESKKQIALFRELGIVTANGTNKFFDQEGKLRGLGEVAQILTESLEGMTEQQKLSTLETMFGSDAIRAAAVFAKQGGDGFNNMAEAMAKVTAEAVAAERLNNLAGDIEQLTGSLETAGIKIGMAFLPGLRSITQGATEMVNQSAPVLESFATRASGAITEASRQIQDSWRTAQQAFAGGWAPSAEIDPFVNSVGQAALALKDLATWVDAVGAKASAMGTLDSLSRGLGSMKENSAGIAGNLQGLSDALGRLGESAAGADGKINLLAGSIRTVALGFELFVSNASLIIDSTIQVARVFADLVDITLNAGRIFVATMSGNQGAAEAAATALGVSLGDMIASTQAWADRTATNVAGVQTSLTSAGQDAGLFASNVQTGMDGAATAAEVGGQAMAAGVLAGADQSVAAIEAAGPQMAAAAESGASQAVAAVEGQAGAASGAGQSIGQALGSGLEGGIMAYVGRVAAAAANLVRSAIGAANAEGEIRSPSERTKKTGRSLAEGVAVGIAELAPAVQAEMRALIDAAASYAPVAGEIARVEKEIASFREKGQTDALWRAKEMVTIDSEALRLKQALVTAERDLLPTRQELARVSREIETAERGSLQARQDAIRFEGSRALNNIEMNKLEKERIPLRQQQLALERQLVGLDSDGKRAKAIQKDIDRLRDKDALIANSIEQARLTTRAQELDIANSKEATTVATTGARLRREALGDQVRDQETANRATQDAIDVLGAEQAVARAGEAIISNILANEIAERQRLIAVFKAEGAPIQERITAGLAYVEQLRREGVINDDLAGKIKEYVEQTGKAAVSTASLGTAAQTAAPQIDAAAQKAAEMAKQAQSIATATGDAKRGFIDLGQTIGKLPSLRNLPDAIFKPDHRASGGPVQAGMPYVVGERRPELFVPDRSGTILPSSSIGYGGGDTIIVNLNAQGFIFERELPGLVGKALGQHLRRGGEIG